MSPQKRINRLVRKPLQLKLIATFGAMAGAATFVQIGLLGQAFLSVASSMPEIESEVYAALPGILGKNLLWAIGFLVPCMLLVGMRVTHKVAGPAHSISRYLTNIAEGEKPSAPCRIRKHDQLQGLVSAINAAVTRLVRDSEGVTTPTNEVYSTPPPIFIRRKVKLIDKPLQLRMVGAFLVVGVLAGVFQLVIMGNSMLSLSNAIGEPAIALMDHAPVIIARTMVITMVLVVPTTLGLGISVTHRVAGPAYRMRMYLEEVARTGAPERPCKIRDKDELRDVCILVNQAVEALTALATESKAPQADTQLASAPSLLPTEPQETSDTEPSQEQGQ